MYIKKKKKPYNQKTANLTPEEQALRAENLAARKDFDPDAVKRLCSTICLQAVLEYRKMRRKLVIMKPTIRFQEECRRERDPRGRKPSPDKPDRYTEEYNQLLEDIADCEDFFDSEMFVQCTGLKGREEAIPKILKMSEVAMAAIKGRLAKG